ncbi:hypothetical protein GS584_16420 [Rhodococcus hoagii]|nr:hypothetical protein [Prescottella equi]
MRQRQQRRVVDRRHVGVHALCDGKDKLSGAGSSAQKNAMDEFTSILHRGLPAKGKSVNVAYNPSGSGDGRTQFIANQIDFAPAPTRRSRVSRPSRPSSVAQGNDAWNLPLVFGPVAIAYNLDGVDGLVLNGETIAKSSTAASPTGTTRPSPR